MSSRRQCTSCESCRKSRLGCDAGSKKGHSCSNCIRRNKQCTVTWDANVKSHRRAETHTSSEQYRTTLFRPFESTAHEDESTTQHTSSPDTRTSKVQELLDGAFDTKRQQALALHHTLWDIFTENFEPQLGLWIGNDCNPFLHIVTAPKTLVSRLMVTLDNSPRGAVDLNEVRSLGMSLYIPDRSDDDESITNQALISSVHSFSARWLPIDYFMKGSQSTPDALKRKEIFVESTWRIAHRDVLKVITKPSYRSILALYLFGITPTSPTNKDRKSSAFCSETSLRHYIQLRTASHLFPYGKSNTLQDGSWNMEFRSPLLHGTVKGIIEYAHLEETAYWLGIVCDTSRSLVHCQPSILLPGLSGDTKVWDLVRKKIKDFDMVYRPTHSSKLILTDERVLTILQFGSSHKTLCWAAITRVQDALFYHNTGFSVRQALENALRDLDWFEDVFGPLLDQCTRDYLLLSDSSRISYWKSTRKSKLLDLLTYATVLLSLHFNLGVLILLDTLDCIQNLSLHSITQFNSVDYRLSSTRAIVNLINLVLQTDERLNDSPTSILLRDPYPEHVSNGLSRTARSLLQLHKTKILPAATVEMMSSALFTGLDILSQISYSATSSLAELQSHYDNAKLKFKTRQRDPLLCGMPSPISPEILQDEIVHGLENQAIADPALVRKSIERHEKIDDISMFIPDDLQWMDIISGGQDWAFDDCFINI